MFDQISTDKLRSVYETLLNYKPREFGHGQLEDRTPGRVTQRCLVGALRYMSHGNADIRPASGYPLTRPQESQLWCANDSCFGEETAAERYSRMMKTLREELETRDREKQSDLPVPDFTQVPVEA